MIVPANVVRERKGCFVESFVESLGDGRRTKMVVLLSLWATVDSRRSKMRLSERRNGGAMERRSESVDAGWRSDVWTVRVSGSEVTVLLRLWLGMKLGDVRSVG